MELTKAMTVFLGDQGSNNTARTYSCGLRRFFEWASITKVEDLDPKQAIPFARVLKREGLSPRSITSYLSALIQFLYWLKREKVAEVSADALMDLKEQVKDWNKKNKTKKLPRLPKETAVTATVEATQTGSAENQRERLLRMRNAAMVATWMATGCRISETANLKRTDLEGNMTAWVRKGKGDKDRLIIFTDKQAWATVQAYLTERDKLGYAVNGEEPLLARHDKATHGRGEIQPISANGMREALATLQKKANIEHFTPHQLRHKAATDLYNRTGDIKAVQEYLGHEDVSTTAGTYTHLSNDRLIEIVRGG